MTPLIGVIGGSGFYKLDNLTHVEDIDVTTPWGKPSSKVMILNLPSNVQIAFIARHGIHHSLTPSEVNSQANIAALKHIGVKAIVAFSAVGSLREEIKPGDFVIPNQIIDRTKSIRQHTFFGPGQGVVTHAMFGEPFSPSLSNFIAPLIKEVLPDNVDLHTSTDQSDKTVICMEGPQFSTRAESRMYQQLGGDIINMSVLPEAKLAREAELSYSLICTSTDYDAWRINEEPVTVAEVIKTLTTNATNSKHVVQNVLQHVHEALLKEGILTEQGSMQYSIITPKERFTQEAKNTLSFILPDYFK
ncbi:glutamate biosynthesis-related protein [Wallemia mellicola]|uniref:S-methyl-5'-thioadenosine phosphorylase n=1 Tax=Wallemia mellicola TaxID=1708541 RepID=A0A4T0QQL8_9BASI|nr:glutamate biosynthesis-related protein [Wallemia mellicola]TIB90337.1 glutamate biosynthesis-related protein [Wallemia mellicola]TIC00446.1 glutamate biosynthesis-related protein [Wallemia mellicola]TIC06319.1 glutamate biosynthesis-related protein [Wallemia mellicola]TIC24597.1 glutamate biosynthesis-related protein [Wallemia mellicola]